MVAFIAIAVLDYYFSRFLVLKDTITAVVYIAGSSLIVGHKFIEKTFVIRIRSVVVGNAE